MIWRKTVEKAGIAPARQRLTLIAGKLKEWAPTDRDNELIMVGFGLQSLVVRSAQRRLQLRSRRNTGRWVRYTTILQRFTVNELVMVGFGLQSLVQHNDVYS